MKKIEELKSIAGVDDNPDQKGLNLFAETIINECLDLVKVHTLKSSGITEPYTGKVIICEIIKEYFSK
jgi:hypothetical protein